MTGIRQVNSATSSVEPESTPIAELHLQPFEYPSEHGNQCPIHFSRTMPQMKSPQRARRLRLFANIRFPQAPAIAALTRRFQPARLPPRGPQSPTRLHERSGRLDSRPAGGLIAGGTEWQ